MQSAIDRHFNRHANESTRDSLLHELTPDTRLLSLRHELRDVDINFDRKKEAFKMKRDALKQRQTDLEKRELDMREYLNKFDKFLQENESKRIKALKKAEDAKEITQMKDAEKDRLINEIAALQRRKEKLRRQVAGHKIYPDFLGRVVETSEDYQELRDITGRYNTMVSTRESLLESHTKAQENLKETRQFLVQFIQAKDIEILQCNLELSQLQKKLDESRLVSDQMEAKWSNISSTDARKAFLLGKIVMVTNNLYYLLEKIKRERRGHESDASELGNITERLTTQQKLDQIKEQMLDLQDIVREKKRKNWSFSSGPAA